MIQAHLFDSWTRADARDTWPFAWAMIVAGFGAPMFLFLAGTSVALSAGSKYRRSGDVAAASRAVMKRGWWIFFLAFVFRIQAWILGWGSPRTLLKVDILNIMGPSIAAAAALWGAFRSTKSRAIAVGLVALVIAFATPIVRSTPLLDPLPNPVEAYLRPIPGLSNFFLFSWSGFVFAGAIAGVLLDAARAPAAEARVNTWLFAAGTAVAVGAYGASFLPTPYADSQFWGSSPAFFLLRTGILLVLIPAAFVWERVLPGGWSPMQQLGRTSLFIYWIHVEMVYGLISLPIHKSLTHAQAWIAFALFTLFMLACSIAKDWFVARGGGPSAASNRGGSAEPASGRLRVPGARVSTSPTAHE